MFVGKTYIGSKIISAYPLSENDFLGIEKGKDVSNRENRPGYLIKHLDGHVSWSPKEVFEIVYREVIPSEKAMIKIQSENNKAFDFDQAKQRLGR